MMPRSDRYPIILSRGFSAVEVMVALIIGVIITAAIGQIFVGSHATYQLDEGLARLQENGRFATDFLSNEIRQAGNFGCVSGDGGTLRRINNYLVGGGGAAFDLSTPIQGFEYTATGPGKNLTLPSSGSTTNSSWSPTLTSLVTGAVAGSDVIIVRRIESEGYRTITQDLNGVSIETPNELVDGDVVMIGNCVNASLFQASIASGTPGTLSHPAGGSYAPGNTCTTWGSSNCELSDTTMGTTTPPEVNRFAVTAFYVGRRNGNDVPSLYRARWAPGGVVSEELVEGVESMQALYGVDTDNDPNHNADLYVPADQVGNWGRVVSVQLSLLLRTLSTTTNGGGVRSNTEQSRDTNTYSVAGTNVTINPADFNRRRVFTTMIKLRNR